MKGILILDKPRGPTSNQVTIWVKNILKTKSAHSGTLDPDVSGVFPVLIGKGIKLLEYLQKHDKEYVCLMELEKTVSENKIKQALKTFEGKIYQKPPEISAVAKKTRIRKIYQIDLLEVDRNYILFKVYCQHGTYIRKLVGDVGHLLGIKIKMLELRRAKSGPFTEDDTVTLTKLLDAYKLKDEKPELLEKIILPLEYAVKKFPKVVVKNTAVKNIANGADVMKPGVISLQGHIVKDTFVAIMDEDKRLIGVGLAKYEKAQIEKMSRGAVIKTKKIVI